MTNVNMKVVASLHTVDSNFESSYFGPNKSSGLGGFSKFDLGSI